MQACLPEAVTGAQFSTYRIGGVIQAAYQPTSLEEAVATLQEIRGHNTPFTILGAGSNTLIASAGITGNTFITKKLTWVEEKGDGRFLFGAGVHLAKAAKVAQQHSLTGAEYMIGIPGTVGGAVRMNAGALGQETASVVCYVFLFNQEAGELEIWDQEALKFQYRKSAIDPQRHIVLGVECQFKPGRLDEITAMMEKSIAFRKTHHPTEPNGGSVFKNPSPEMTAGKMLDDLGAKTWQEGGVRISPLHANFIINQDNGTSTDVLRLMVRMKRAIYEHYGFKAHPENLLVGETTPEEQSLWKELTDD